MTSADIDKQVCDLERRAGEVCSLLPFAPRAFVIEFAGTPKSGKSTSVEAIRHFFNRQGFNVYVLIERASVCPIPMKGHLFFNTWCAATMLAGLIENVDTETDIIIVDRGLFDSLVWLTLQRQRGELTEDEAKTIEEFLLLKRWRTLIDLAVVMNVEAEVAIERENSQRISLKAGSIMNPEVLSTISQSVSDTVTEYGPKFSSVVEHDTSGETVKESNLRLAGKIVDHLESFLNPEILVVPRAKLEKLPLQDGGEFSASSNDKLIDIISTYGTCMKRSEAEENDDHVQIIACGLLTHKGRLFLFERKERDPKYRLYGKLTVWQGCHVPTQGGKSGMELLQSALLERISRSLFLSRIFPVKLEGYCWDPTIENSKRHFGVMFSVTINNDHTATDLRKKEFRKGRGHDVSGSFIGMGELASSDAHSNLESWSQACLRGLTNAQ